MTVTATTTRPLALRVERHGGRTVIERSGGHVPLAARTVRGRPGWASVVLVQTTAGPLGGDRIELDVEVGPGAALELTSAGAMLAYPARERATLSASCRVASGGRLAWLAQPLILAAGCDLESTIELELADGAAAVVREWIALGRHAEEPGSYRGVTRCDLDGQPLLRDGIVIGGDQAGPAVLGSANAYGTLAVLGARPAAEPEPDELELAGPGRLLRTLGSCIERRLARAEPLFLGAL